MTKQSKCYQNIIFDLDGTLSDPSVGIFNGFRKALSKMDVKNVDESIFSLMIGPPLQDSFKKYFFEDDKQILEAVGHFRDYYSKIGLLENKVYDGIPQLLEQLKQKGKKMFVATNKPQPFADRILVHFNLAHYFDSIHGVDINPLKGKSCKVELLDIILKEMNEQEMNQTIIVGDTIYDVEAGKQFKIDTAAITYGFGLKKSLSITQPTILLDSVGQLEDFLISSNK